MEFLDEKILEFRRRARNEEHMDLESGMYIDGELMEFERVKLFDGKMDIMLPSSFIDLPSNLARIKYPSEQRPHIIKTSLDTSVNMTFSLYGMKIRCDQTKKAAEDKKVIRLKDFETAEVRRMYVLNYIFLAVALFQKMIPDLVRQIREHCPDLAGDLQVAMGILMEKPVLLYGKESDRE
jgi:hypothetical protein